MPTPTITPPPPPAAGIARDTPVRADLDRLIRQVAADTGSVHHDATYVSMPITTGRALMDWLAGYAGPMTGPEFADAHRREVIQVNARQVASLLRRAQAALPGPVVDPSAYEFDLPQDDYHLLWTEFLTRHAARLVMADGWQFSRGCALEYQTAVDLDLKVLGADLEPLSVPTAARLLADAATRLAAAGLDPSTARQVLESLPAPR